MPANNNCNKSTQVIPTTGSQKRFTLLEHNSRAIRDILLGTNIHLDDPKDVIVMCQILNDMNSVAVKLSEAKLHDRRQRVAIAELSMTLGHQRKTIEIQDMQIATQDKTIDKLDTLANKWQKIAEEVDRIAEGKEDKSNG